MKNIPAYKFAIILASLILIIGTYVWGKISINRNKSEVVENISNTNFNAEHYNYIYVDTFVELLQKAYGQQVNTVMHTNELKVNIEGAGIVTKDFYNGNDALLDINYDDFGFKFDYNKNTNALQALFRIKDGAIPVPNDVMIKIIDKTYNK
jgi:hypothetical protein